MKLIYTKLPDSQRLKHRTLATVIAPNQQVKLSKVVDLFAHTFKIAQGQSGNHCGVSLSQGCGRLSILIALSTFITSLIDMRPLVHTYQKFAAGAARHSVAGIGLPAFFAASSQASSAW